MLLNTNFLYTQPPCILTLIKLSVSLATTKWVLASERMPIVCSSTPRELISIYGLLIHLFYDLMFTDLFFNFIIIIVIFLHPLVAATLFVSFFRLDTILCTFLRRKTMDIVLATLLVVFKGYTNVASFINFT